MREVEVKAHLKDKETVMKKLTELGCVFEKSITQKDTVYAKKVGSLESFLDNDAYLRIRVKANGKIVFTIKKPVKGLDKIEHETEILNGKEMHEALLLMGYKEGVKVNKTRTTTTCNGCEICIDEVEDLGTFIEMEKMTDGTDSNKVQHELFEFLKTLGVEEKDQVHVGYDILMLSR